MQKPHWSPWHSRNACCTGPSRPSGEPSALGQALDGGDLGSPPPTRRTSGTSARAGRPRARCRRRRRRARSRRGCRSGRGRGAGRRTAAVARGTRTSWATPLTTSRTSCELLAHRRPPADARASSYAARRTRAVSTRTSWRAVGRGGVDVVGRVERVEGERTLRPRRASSRSRRRARLGQVDDGRDVGDREVAGPGGDHLARPRPARRPRRRTARSRRAAGRSPRSPRPLPAPAPGRTPRRRSRRGAASTPAVRRTGRRPGSSRLPDVDARSRSRRAAPAPSGISAAASAWTIEPTAVPRLRIVAWATCASARRHQRLHPAYVGRGQHVGVPRQRADADAASASTRTWSRSGSAVDVDQRRRRREPHVQQRAPGSARPRAPSPPDRPPGPPARAGGPAVGRTRTVPASTHSWLGSAPVPGLGRSACRRPGATAPGSRGRVPRPSAAVDQVEVHDDHDRAQRDAAELEVAADRQGDPADAGDQAGRARPTRLTGSPKSTPFSTQILAPTRPIMP